MSDEETPEDRKRHNALIRRSDLKDVIMQLMLAEMAKGSSMGTALFEAKRCAKDIVAWLDENAELKEMDVI